MQERRLCCCGPVMHMDENNCIEKCLNVDEIRARMRAREI